MEGIKRKKEEKVVTARFVGVDNNFYIYEFDPPIDVKAGERFWIKCEDTNIEDINERISKRIRDTN